ncbi:MAG TPA: alanine racemase [Cellvibrionaceae bacterium]
MNSNTGLLHINLQAVADNWRTLLGQCRAQVAAVVKADAYGLGAEQVAPALYGAGCRHFFVATKSEGLALRQFIPGDARCFVLGGAARGDEEECLRGQLTPVLSSLAAISDWLDAVGSAPCAIKFDTGMTRLGLPLSEDNLSDYRDAIISAKPVLMMSHLACADEPDHPQNAQQLQRFDRVREQLGADLPATSWSLANSSGIFLGADYHADMVRPGAALYGFNPQLDQPSPVQPVVSLDLPVLQLRRVGVDTTVGYGATTIAPAGSVLAVAAGGYADGVHRLLGNAGYGYCMGQQVPVLGRVSMDTAVFDVSTVAGIDQLLQAGRWRSMTIAVINATVDVTAISQRNGSLGYEVLTSLGSGRYQRRYQQASKHER